MVWCRGIEVLCRKLVVVVCLLGHTIIQPTRASSSTTNLTYVILEEHWISPALTNLTAVNPVFQLLITKNGIFGQYTVTALKDMGAIRLANMTSNNIRMQVVSNSPTPAALDQPVLVKHANDELASLVGVYPDRFRAWAYLPMAYPDLAAQELERCVTQLGFMGALIDNHLANGTYYDGQQFWPVWSKAQELDVPIYLHPTLPNSSSVLGQSFGIYAPALPTDFPLTTAAALATAAWGFHEDVGRHFLRLYTGGVFAEFPNLKIILGHMGEMIPFMLERSNKFLSRGLNTTNSSSASLVDIYAKNVWITTAGFFSLDPFSTILRNTAIDRIMYSVDYPFSSSRDGAAFMAELKKSGMVNLTEWEAIAHGNAEKLLGL